jgi:hypothetical protein
MPSMPLLQGFGIAGFFRLSVLCPFAYSGVLGLRAAHRTLGVGPGGPTRDKGRSVGKTAVPIFIERTGTGAVQCGAFYY